MPCHANIHLTMPLSLPSLSLSLVRSPPSSMLLAVGCSPSTAEGGATADESAVRADSTWFRKRLLELHPASKPLDPKALLASIHDALPAAGAEEEEAGAEVSSAKASPSPSSSAAWSVRLTPVAWERQVGPCCGLAAIRMARSALDPTPREQAAAPAAASAEAPPKAPAPAAVRLSAAAAAAPGVASPSAATMAMWGGLLGGSVELHLPGNATAAPGASVLHAAIERGFSSDGEVCAARACKLMRANPCMQTHASKLMRANSCEQSAEQCRLLQANCSH
jgi:hypothetical protein